MKEYLITVKTLCLFFNIHLKQAVSTFLTLPFQETRANDPLTDTAVE
jgi:hypothetical protein